jgi:hypothetical protein
MPPRAEQSPLRLLADAFQVVLLALAAMAMYVWLEPSWRGPAVRLGCAVIVVVGSSRVIRGLRRSLDADAPSPLDAARVAASAPELHEGFVKLRDEIAVSTRSRRYFDLTLWPRLLALCGPGLAPPARRRGILSDGPSVRAIERLVANVEERA